MEIMITIKIVNISITLFLIPFHVPSLNLLPSPSPKTTTDLLSVIKAWVAFSRILDKWHPLFVLFMWLLSA